MAPAGFDDLINALLSTDQTRALACITHPDLLRLLRAAGVPVGAGDSLDTLRGKCAATVWAAGQLRQPQEVYDLPDDLPEQVSSIFGIPSGWSQAVRNQTLAAVLIACRNSSWALDPALSFGLVDAHRSGIYRAAEAIVFPTAQSEISQLDSHLSAEDSSQLESMLSKAGRSLKDMAYTDGKWAFSGGADSGGGQARSSAVDAGGVSTAALETQLRTLHVHPYTLLTPEERKDQASRSKVAPPRKRQAAFPGDTETEAPEDSLNPFSEWPWMQGLVLKPTDSYSLAGRLVRNTLRWCNAHFTDALMQVTFKTHETLQEKLLGDFNSAIDAHQLDRALLIAHKALSEARDEMAAIVANSRLFASQHPNSVFLEHVATQRVAQAAELKTYLNELSQRITDAAGKSGTSEAQHAAAAHRDFLTGWLCKTGDAHISSESLQHTASVAPAAPTAAPAPAHYSSSAPAQSGGSGRPAKAARSTTPVGGGRGGRSTRSATTAVSFAGTPSLPIGRICVLQQNIPCSQDIVGDHLGVSGTPMCRLCGQGAHYHGECPTAWGNLGKPLPGFRADGSRAAKKWKGNEPIAKTVTAWVNFLSDPSNFSVPVPSPAGVSGAPTLADFQARVATAPAKP